MSKASPIIRSFNAGEMSPLMSGRTDIDRYPASCRALLNCVAAPQGPAIPRSGTEFTQAVYDEAKKSALFPFSTGDEQDYMIEFADQRCRFFTEDGGILIYTPVAATMVTQSPFVLAMPTLGANVGDEIVLQGWPDEYNLNGEVAKITAKVSNNYTLNILHPSGLPNAVGISAGRVYHVVSPYTEDMLDGIRGLQIIDVVRLVNEKARPYKLKRKDTYDWVFETMEFEDGPYYDINQTTTNLTIDVTGRATSDMTGDSAPAGYTASASGNNGASASYYAWDATDATTHWRSDVDQSGWVQIQAPVAFVCDGYYLVGPVASGDINYTPKDLAPSTWKLLASNDGSTWVTLDSQTSFVLYTKNRTPFFKLKNAVAYKYYRVDIKACVRNGGIPPYVRSVVLRSPASSTITITASSTVGINNDAGFKTTDVGRLIRLKGSDGIWRWLKITGRTSSTVIVATLMNDPFPNKEPITDWRLGYWSETTGWPNVLAYYQDRMWYGGSDAVPDLIVGSTTENYENMAPSDPDDVVVDTNSIVNILNSRKRSRVMWLAANEKAFLAGTGSQEFVIASDGASKVLTPGTATAKESSARGSAKVEPVVVDKAVLFLQRAARTLRENAWVYEADGFKAPSMSNLASHLGAVPFEQMVFAAEPYSIVWLRRRDGKLMGMTYNRDENVVGWHRHDLSGGFVESMAVLQSSDGLQDTLWMVVRRTVKGQTRRYIEKLTRFWDFNMTIDDAHFVDCGLRYIGEEAVSIIYGLQHLEGESIYGLADNIPFGPKQVLNGRIDLETPATNVIAGLGFESLTETSSLENGAQDGTAIGKTKRTHRFVLNLWQSYGGQVGTFDESVNEIKWTDVEYPQYDLTAIEGIELYDGITDPITPAPGYQRKGSLYFRRTKDIPLPFNVVSIMPQLVTQDG